MDYAVLPQQPRKLHTNTAGSLESCVHCSVQVCVLGAADGRLHLGGGRDGVHGGQAGERAGAAGRAHLVPRHPRGHPGGRRQIRVPGSKAMVNHIHLPAAGRGLMTAITAIIINYPDNDHKPGLSSKLNCSGKTSQPTRSSTN